MNGVEIGSALPAALDCDQPYITQFLDISVDTLSGCTHVLSKTVLTWKALIEFTGVFEKHGIGEFGTNGNLFTF